jgi:LuxR family maltose regulon positive regulatory protein
LREAERLLRAGWAEATDRGAPPAVTATLLGLAVGEARRERGDLAAAGDILSESIEAGRPWFSLLHQVYALTALARVRQAQGDDTGAQAAIEEAGRLAPKAGIWPGVEEQVAAHQARLWLARGRVEEADAWARAQGPSGAGPPGRHPFIYADAVAPTLARVWLARGQVDEVERLLDDRLRVAEAAGLTGRVIEILSLRALARQARGRPAEAVAALGEALALAEPEGYVRLFADEGAPMAALLRHGLEARSWGRDAGERDRLAAYARSLLPTFEPGPPADGATSAPAHPALPAPTVPRPTLRLVEPLSEREREVLRLVATGRSNAEIARDLVVELSTVKTHLNNLYGKLGVHTRTQALARARELGLLA